MKTSVQATAAHLAIEFGRTVHGWLRLSLCLAVIAALPQPAFSASLAAGAGKYVVHDEATHSYVTVYYYKPKHYTPDTPIVFVLHGIKRNAADYRDSWIKQAEQDDFMILTPRFSRSVFRGANGYNLGNVFHAVTHEEAIGRIKPHGINPPQKWAGALIERLFADFRSHRDKTHRGRYFLYGHGAGAQFVTHTMMFMPNLHVDLAIAASAGWYTMPESSMNWPYGIGDVPQVTPDMLKAFYRAPLMLVIGDKDTRTKNTIMRQNKYTDTEGNNRLARARYFYDFCSKRAENLGVPCNWKLKIVPGVGHRVDDMVPAVAAVISAAAQRQSGDAQ